MVLAACCSSTTVAQDAPLTTDSIGQQAEQGNAFARTELGMICANGGGVTVHALAYTSGHISRAGFDASAPKL